MSDPNNKLLPAELLLVENDPREIASARNALREGKIKNRLNVVSGGREAMEYLRQEGEFSDARRPDVILFDFSLVKAGGRNFYSEIKADPRLNCIPLVFLMITSAQQDILNTWTDYGKHFIVKPVDYCQLVTVLRSLENYWLTLVRTSEAGC